jgi:polyhydroxybutyrate depolymerase
MRTPKLLLISCVFAFCTVLTHAQTVKTILHNGLTRSYIEYIPASYTGNTSLPLLIALHGWNDQSITFSNAGFQILGGIENFITIYPQGATGIIGTGWNAGVQYYNIPINGDIDDVGFIDVLLDTLISEYNIDQTRIYATGFSLGGFMTNRLACELSHRFAAVASVAGTRGNMITGCTPLRSVPFCHIHGNQDEVVLYSNNIFGMDTEQLVDWWVLFNQCNPTPVVTQLPDLVQDSITVTHFEYSGGTGGSRVEFYMADGAGHVWLYQPVNDVSYTILIWDFLKNHSLTNLSVNENLSSGRLGVTPGIADETINIIFSSGIKTIRFSMYDISGKMVYLQNISDSEFSADVSNLAPGLYVWKAETDQQQVLSGKIMIQR